MQVARSSGTAGVTDGFGSVRGGLLATMAHWNSVRKSWFGVSADPQKSPGRIGEILKVRSKLKTASVWNLQIGTRRRNGIVDSIVYSILFRR